MRKHITVRPARAAIAAVLALASTPLLAQVADTAAPPPVAATQPAAPVISAAPPVVATTSPVAATPVMKPQSPVVQSVPAPAPVVAEAITEAPAPAPVRSERVRVERPASREVSPVAERVAAPVETVAPVAQVEATPVAAPAESVSPVVPATDPVSANPADSGALEWGLIGGGVIVLGGAALLAMTRRRRTREEHTPVIYKDTTHDVMRDEPLAKPATVADTMPPRTVITPAPAYATARPVADHAHGNLDAMIAAPPSAENPFRTRKNRLRRAHFLLRQGNIGASQPMPEMAVNVAPRRSPVYDFGGNVGQRRIWRPATT